MAFRLTYLHLTLAHSKGQGKSHTQFTCEYVADANEQKNRYNCHQIRSDISAFSRHIYSSPWPILKDNVRLTYVFTVNIPWAILNVNVSVMHISTVTIAEN